MRLNGILRLLGGGFQRWRQFCIDCLSKAVRGRFIALDEPRSAGLDLISRSGAVVLMIEP